MNKVLFVCQHNTARSVMAEAFLNALSGGRFQAESAGLEPREVHPLVVKAMAEAGLDVSGHKPRSVFDLFREGNLYTHVIAVCDAETDAKCPIFPGVAYRVNWPFPDPAEAAGSEEEKMRQVRDIRDRIKRTIKEFLVDEGA
ncbi:MAG: arsenate reductase ArsC [Desulfovibrionaceae bacterium]